MGKAERQLAAGNFRQHLGLQFVVAAELQQSACQHHGGEIRLERERTADLLHHDHGFDRPAADAAMLFGKRQAEQAKLGVLPPEVAAPAGRFLCVAFARVELIAVGKQPLDALLQQPLFVVQRKIHFTAPISLCK